MDNFFRRPIAALHRAGDSGGERAGGRFAGEKQRVIDGSGLAFKRLGSADRCIAISSAGNPNALPIEYVALSKRRPHPPLRDKDKRSGLIVECSATQLTVRFTAKSLPNDIFPSAFFRDLQSTR
jgi:hypothetical protein